MFSWFPQYKCEGSNWPAICGINIVNVQCKTWFPKSLQTNFLSLSVFFIPGLLDFVLSKSIFTHSSLLCIVLRVSCPQSTSCSIGVLVLYVIGLSTMSLAWGDGSVMG